MALIIILTLLFPLTGFIISSMLSQILPKNFSGIFCSLMILFSFICTLLIFSNISHSEAYTVQLFTWINTDSLTINISFLADNLSILMALIVTGVSSLIHVYSIGYMKGDNGINRYFSFMNLFVFFMLILVFATDYIIMFIGWEGVGLCSYFLIGFWNKNNEFNKAAIKAFVMNRIGDCGFLLGVFLLYLTFGTTEFAGIFSQLHEGLNGTTVITLITILLFIGATGKSAQIPLFTWLPDAMAGPTPVSALIHAATMVTAGIYMVVRSAPLYELAPITQNTIVIIGSITAVAAASIAIFQNDIKKILAYSTISQLGFIFIGTGIGAYTASMFHLTTHAFFKALLFLGAGCIIHALKGEQNILKMGGLKKYSKFVFIPFFIATMAISGVPPFSGFFSKEMLLSQLYHNNIILWLTAILISILTVMYSFRLLFIVFYGKSNESPANMHSVPKVMSITISILAVFAFIGGMIGMPEFTGITDIFSKYLTLLPDQNSIHNHFTEIILMIITLSIIAISIYISRKIFYKPHNILSDSQHPVIRLIKNKFYVDEIYNKLIIMPFNSLSNFMFNTIDIKIIDRIVEKTGNFTIKSGNLTRYLQSGEISIYLTIITLASIILIIFTVL